MFTRVFWRDAAERAVKTAAQFVVAVIGTGAVSSVIDVDWQTVLGGAALGAILSLATSLASLKVGESGTASALPTSSGG